MRVTRALGTSNRAAAKVKLERVLAEARAAPSGTTRKALSASVQRGETFKQAARRVHELRRTVFKPKNADAGLSLLARHAFDLIGALPAAAVRTADVNTVLDAAAASGSGRGSVDLLRQHLSAVFVQLCREGVVTENPVESATMPAFATSVQRERAVLTDEELAVYFEWQHPKPGRRMGVLERQVMSSVARMFGGVRTGDLHTMRWESLDVEHGAFTWGWAPRRKTRRPQLLEIPELLRPMLLRWWALAGRPREGLVFPVRRENCSNNRAGLERKNVSHAEAMRRDLERAFEFATERGVAAPRRGSQRWRQIFVETEHTRPVDFHSWRRAYCQALDDAGVTLQQAAALAGHENFATHGGYLRNASKMRRLPPEAVPQLRPRPREKALSKGRAQRNPEESEPEPAPALLFSAPCTCRGFSRASWRKSGVKGRVRIIRDSP